METTRGKSPPIARKEEAEEKESPPLPNLPLPVFCVPSREAGLVFSLFGRLQCALCHTFFNSDEEIILHHRLRLCQRCGFCDCLLENVDEAAWHWAKHGDAFADLERDRLFCPPPGLHAFWFGDNNPTCVVSDRTAALSATAAAAPPAKAFAPSSHFSPPSSPPPSDKRNIDDFFSAEKGARDDAEEQEAVRFPH